MSYDNFDEDETWWDWLILVTAAALTTWIIIHLIEVISNWFVK